MTAVRVYVGTTEGPAEIQRITDEPPGIRSVVCLDGKAVALPISGDYDSFIRRPTGVVERLYGHSAFRMDVGARITDGLSWQLGALLAHSLHAANRLATAGKPADLVVWATGEVDAALAVRPVDAVARKLQLSADLLRGVAASGTRIAILVPSEAEAVARATLTEVQLAHAVRLIPAASAEDAFAAIGPAKPELPKKQTEPPRVRRRRSRGRFWIGAGVVLCGIVAATLAIAASWREPIADWQRLAAAGEFPKLQADLLATETAPRCLTCATVAGLFRERLATQRPARSDLRVEAAEIRGSRFGGCPDLAEAETSTHPIARTSETAFAPSPAVGLCGIRFSVSGAPYVALIVSTSRASFLEPTRSISVGSERTQVEVSVPHWIASPIQTRLLVMAAASRLDRVVEAVSAKGDDTEQPLSAEALEQLAGPSVLVFEVRHSIVP